MKPERKLIKENESYTRDLRQALNSYRSHLKKVAETFAGMEMGEFDNKVWKKIARRGAKSFEKAHLDNLDRQMKQAGLTNSMLRSKMKDEIYVQYYNFEQAYNALKSHVNSYKGLSLENIDYIDGRFVVTEETQEALLEKNGRIYLETNEEFKLHGAVEKLRDAFLGVENALTEVKHPDAGNYRRFVNAFLSFEDAGIEINANTIKDAPKVYEERQRMLAEQRRWEEQEKEEARLVEEYHRKETAKLKKEREEQAIRDVKNGVKANQNINKHLNSGNGRSGAMADVYQ